MVCGSGQVTGTKFLMEQTCISIRVAYRRKMVEPVITYLTSCRLSATGRRVGRMLAFQSAISNGEFPDRSRSEVFRARLLPEQSHNAIHVARSKRENFHGPA